MSTPLVLLVKATILLAVSLAIAPALRRCLAATRHQLWSGVLAAVLLLPMLSWLVPQLSVPVPDAWSRPTLPAAIRPAAAAAPATTRTANSVADTTPAAGMGAFLTTRDPAPRSWMRLMPTSAADLFLFVWAAGTLASLVMLSAAHVNVRRLARHTAALTDAPWTDAATRIAHQVGLRRPPRLLLLRDRAASPMAGGLFSPVVFLPADAPGWRDDVREVVLAHELAHLAAGDPLRHVIARLTVALYWFSPLAWMAAARASTAREDACDEAVLAIGTPPSSYARVLLELADGAHPSAVLAAALPMVQRSHLEERLMTILNRDRSSASRPTMSVALGLLALTIAIAAVRPSARVSDAAIDAGAAIDVPAAIADGTAPVWARMPDRPAIADTQSGVDPASACWSDGSDNRSFSGTTSSTGRAGRTEISQQIGRRGADRVIEQSFGSLRVCMIAENAGPDEAIPSQLPGRAGRVVFETRRDTTVQRLEVTSGGLTRWQVNGRDHAVDRAAETWRTAILALLDTTWEASRLRGEVSSLRGQISSIHGQESSLRGQISSLHGQVSSMRGEISSIRGGESSLNGEISSIEGHLSSLRGAISSEEGAISSLNATTYGADSTERSRLRSQAADHQAQIARIEKEIADYGTSARIAAVRKRLAAVDADAGTATVEKRIRDFNLADKEAAIEKQIRDLNVSGQVSAIEQKIRALDADRRTDALDARAEAERKQLDAAIDAIR